MTFVRKFSGKTERDPDRNDRIVCCYTCPEHGEFDAEVQRNENGEAPDEIECTAVVDTPPILQTDGWLKGRHAVFRGYCSLPSTWTPSPVGCRVRRVEAVKGKWEKPERPTYLDTRELAEGMDIEEFEAKRAAIWDEKRKQDVMNIKKGFE